MRRHIAVGLAVSGGLGLLLLPYPFHGDQAWFTVAAARLQEGAVLYADLWDLKQPGVFLFYLGGGTVFGFHEVGIHLFELLYLLAGISLITWLLRGHFESPIALGLVPVLTVGAYYGSVVYPGALTQLEMLVGIPLFLMLWLSASAIENGRWVAWLLGGIFAGIVILFKSMLLLVVIPMWLVIVLPPVRDRTIGLRGVIRAFAFFTVGAVVAWLPFALYVVRHDLWDIVVFTYLTHPPQAMELYARPLSRLIRAVAWFVAMFSPLLLMAGIFLGGGKPAKAAALTPGLVAWSAAGLIVSLLQLWWAYHLYLILLPLGILASMGLDRLLTHSSRPSRALAPAALLCLPMIYFTVNRSASLVAHRFALQPADLLAYQTENWRRYGDLSAVVDEVAFLRDPDTAGGSIWVLGNPVYLYRSGRDPASPIVGWSPGMWPPSIWEQTLADLRASRPPYLFIQQYNEDRLAARGGDLAAWIASTYQKLKTGSAGTWHVRADLAP